MSAAERAMATYKAGGKSRDAATEAVATWKAPAWLKPEHIDAEKARADVARLELALQEMAEQHIGGRQRERLETRLQGARVALAVAEREA